MVFTNAGGSIPFESEEKVISKMYKPISLSNAVTVSSFVTALKLIKAGQLDESCETINVLIGFYCASWIWYDLLNPTCISVGRMLQNLN